MTGSRFNDFKMTSDDEEDAPKSRAQRLVGSLAHLIESIPLIRRVARARAARADSECVDDVSQEVVLRLWKWNEKFPDRMGQMSREEWEAFVRRSTINEINRFFSSRSKLTQVSIDEAKSVVGNSLEGDSFLEVMSQLRKLWQAICLLTLKQRRALLFHSPDLIFYFLQAGISEAEIADALNITTVEWNALCSRLPLTDQEIADLSSDTNRRPVEKRAASVKKARFDARKKLEGFRKV